MHIRSVLRTTVLTTALGLTMGWQVLAQTPNPHAGHHMGAAAAMKAKTQLQPTKDSKVQGWVMFETRNDKMHVWGEFSGLTPGAHGFHIHEFGDCSAPDGTSAGGHFAVPGQSHSAPDQGNHHVGDMGNLSADASGKATFDREFDFLAFHGPHSILGRAVVVHASADDFKSQPAGNAGPRQACGVIGVAKP